MSKGKFVLGALIGAVAGVVAGVLTAPKSGKETRADLKLKAEELKGQADTTATQAKAKADAVVTDALSRADEMKRRTENAVEGAKEGFNKKPSSRG